MDGMYLTEVEEHVGDSPWGVAVVTMRNDDMEVPQIFHLFDFKPAATRHLAAYTQEVMRGPSPLSPGERELIAALTSRLNVCEF